MSKKSQSDFNTRNSSGGATNSGLLSHQTTDQSLSSSFQFQNKSFYDLKFLEEPLPVAINTLDHLCPLCARIVLPNQRVLWHTSTQYGRTFLAHHDCFNSKSSFSLNGLYEDQTHATVSLLKHQQKNKTLPIGGQPYFAVLTLSHPLSKRCLVKLEAKLNAINQTLHWQLTKEDTSDWCKPNLICLPLTSFLLEISITPFKSDSEKVTYKAYVNPRQNDLSSKHDLLIATENLHLEVTVVTDPNEKEALIEKMNLKYPFQRNANIPLILLEKLKVTLGDNEESDCSYEEQSSFKDIQANIDCLLNEDPLTTMAKLDTPKALESAFDSGYEKDKVTLDWLLSSQTLYSFVKKSSQSRLLQVMISKATPNQIQASLICLFPYLSQLITHQYANYMIQKIFVVCSSQQRLQILQALFADLPELARNKQGTHTLQILVSKLQEPEELQMLCMSLSENFFFLANHQHATFLIQKLIDICPIAICQAFYYHATANLLAYSLEKNAMCVLKHMFNKIELEERQNCNDKVLGEVKKALIHAVTLNVASLIQDAFGNYVIQFSFELFGQLRCEGISSMIIERFSDYCQQRFSHSVLLKCLSTYWTNLATVEKLKNSLSRQAILQLFHCKEGNRILLQIMERHEKTIIWQRIYDLLTSVQGSRYYQDRWGLALGSRSSQLSDTRLSFTEASKKASQHQSKRRHP